MTWIIFDSSLLSPCLACMYIRAQLGSGLNRLQQLKAWRTQATGPAMAAALAAQHCSTAAAATERQTGSCVARSEVEEGPQEALGTILIASL